MSEGNYKALMDLLTFIKIENDVILQCLLGTKDYKKVYKTMLKMWEEATNRTDKEI